MFGYDLLPILICISFTGILCTIFPSLEYRTYGIKARLKWIIALFVFIITIFICILKADNIEVMSLEDSSDLGRVFMSAFDAVCIGCYDYQGAVY